MDPTSEAADRRMVKCSVTPAFQEWLQNAGGSIAIASCDAGKVAWVGWDGSAVSLLLRDFHGPMGLAVDGERLAVGTQQGITILANAAPLAPHYPPVKPKNFDALYLPRASYFTGNLDIHDVAFGGEELWFVNTLFSCLSVVSEEHSFVPKWQPRFISQLEPEDRCHMNGLAMRNGKPAFVTAVGQSDTREGWRSMKSAGGIIVNVQSNEIVCTGLSMPHSPRCVGDELWFLNSWVGTLCKCDLSRGSFTSICTLPGFVRGLCIVGNYALVGLSKARDRRTFDGAVVRQFKELKCGVALVDLRNGNEVGRLEFTDGCHEIYDIQFLPDKLRPAVLIEKDNGSNLVLSAPGFGYFLPQPEGTQFPLG